MRLAKLSDDELSPQQKAAWDEVVAGPRKKMHGPFFIWLHSPELLSRGEKLGLYARFQSSLPQRFSELCILMVAALWKAAGEWVDHAPIARFPVPRTLASERCSVSAQFSISLQFSGTTALSP